MKGSYHIRVRNQFVTFDFTIRRNITIIQGNSATGKTTLVDMIREWQTVGQDSGVELNCDKKCVVIEGIQWQDQLALIREESIIFIDEGNRFTESEEFARTVSQSGHYYVIVTREPLYNLPYSVMEIYGIRSSGKYSHLHPVYHEFYPVYVNHESEMIGGTTGSQVDEENCEACNIVTEETQGTYLQYGKASLNPVYLHKHNAEMIVHSMPEQVQKWLQIP